MTAPLFIAGEADVLLIADHASSQVPPGIDLGVNPSLLETHVGIDIGTGALSQRLAAALDAPAIIATVSRLVIDCNRSPNAVDVIPGASDGHIIPGNLLLNPVERALRIDAIHRPYHAHIAARIALARPRLVVGVHSFTPCLATRPDAHRPWPVGILYNRDNRAALFALQWLAGEGMNPGDNQPYSGRDLNYTLNQHAEANDIPYLGLEIRQDGLADEQGIAHWEAIVSRLIPNILAALPG
jgi:predicted N-formylglutamate amidohydrolase